MGAQDRKIKTYRKIDNKIGILGQNVLVIGKKVLAFYIIDAINYSVLDETGTGNHISKLETMLTSLAVQRPGFKFSILEVDKTLTRDDIAKNLIDTVRLWDPSYNDIPEIFKNNIQKSYEEFSILAVNIDAKDIADVENVSFTELSKDYISKITQEFFSLKETKIDPRRVLGIEQSIFDVVSHYGVRASRELTFYTYMSSLFPSYEISYTKNSYVENNFSPILGLAKQSIESKFGYFIMSNLGASLVGLNPTETYGSVLSILKFPERINSSNFKISMPNLRVNVETIPKDKARLIVKRRRADLEFEEETSRDAGARDLDELSESLDLAEQALLDVTHGTVLCNMNASILVLAQDLDTLKSERQRIISTLSDVGVLASIDFDQANAFLQNYVQLTPSDYHHLCELRFPLSFQIDNGVMIGDSDSDFSSPAIGVC